MSQMQQLVHVECKDIFTSPPILNISYLAGSLQTVTLRLPIFLTKFIEPVQLGQNDFFERWKQIGGPPREAQKIFPIKVEGGKVDTAKNRKVVDGTCFGLLDGIDPNPNNIVAAGVLHMSTAGKVGCLLRLEPNTEAKVSKPSGTLLVTWQLTVLLHSFVASRSGARTTPYPPRPSRRLWAL